MRAANRVLAALFLALAALSPLAAPQTALAVDVIISHPPSGMLAYPFSFVVTVAPGTLESLNIVGVDVSIYNDAERSRFESRFGGLPVSSVTIKYPPQPNTNRTSLLIVSAAKDRSYALYHSSWIAPTNFPQGRYRIEAKVATKSQGTITSTSAAFPMYIYSPGRDTDIFDFIDEDGVFMRSIPVQSTDAVFNINILKGTRALDSSGLRVPEISLVTISDLPAPPSGAVVIGDGYVLGPPRTTLSPPAGITMTYHPSRIPGGFTERNLVIASYNTVKDAWVMLQDSVADPATYTVGAQSASFTLYALMAYRFPPSFSLGDLVVSPPRVTSGESSNVTVTVTNRGDISGSYEVELTVDDQRYTTQPVTVEARSSANVTIPVTNTALGVHRIKVGGLSGSFTVLRAPPPTRPPPPSPTASAAPPAPPSPKPSAIPQPPPPKAQSTPTPLVLPPPPPTVSEWVVGAVFVGIIVISLGIWWVARSRRGGVSRGGCHPA